MRAAAKQEKKSDATDAAILGKTIRSCTESTKVFRSAISTAQSIGQQFFYTLAILLVLFIVHQARRSNHTRTHIEFSSASFLRAAQIFVWIDRDPEEAFDRGALLFEVAEITWDTTGLIYNAGIDVVNAGVIPVWNSLSFYFAEPLIVLILEVFSLLFVKKHWKGVFSEEDFPYFGLDCTSSPQAQQWCGRYEYYSNDLQSAEKAPYFADDSMAYERRRLFDANNQTFTFGISTARRLSELTGDGSFAAPSFSIDDLTESIDSFSSVFITLEATIGDIGFAVIGEILKTSFTVIADVIFLGLKSVMYVLKMLTKSGLLTTLVGVGVDMVIIFLTEILIPGIVSTMAAVMCIIDMFRPAGWGEQLKCVEQKCFKGVDAVADMLVFWSMPLLMHQFVSIMEATMNSGTARRFVNVAQNKRFTTKERTRDPETGELIDNEEPESARMSNPVYEFTFASDFADWLPTMGADKCGGCFVCQWPEFRLVWLVAAGISTLISSGNTYTFIGNVSQACLTNGSWYQSACGPWPTTGDDTMLPWLEWSQLPFKYDAGFHEYDAIIYDSYAARFIERSEEIGTGADEQFALLVEASHAWMQLRDTVPYDAMIEDAVQEGRVPEGTEFPNSDEPKAAAFTYQV